MRIRDRLLHVRKIAVYGQIASFLLMAAALAGWSATDLDVCMYVACVGLVGFFGSLVLDRYGVRCPRCRQNIGKRTQHFGETTVLLLRPVRFCLFCGVSLDAPYRP